MAGKRIFIVDDEQEILDSLSRRLTQDGYEVITATGGQEAVRKIRDSSPDLILVDIVLPDIDGPDVVQRIRQAEPSLEIPVIFLSGIVSKEKDGYHSEIKVGGREYPAIAKPFPYEALRALIQEAI